MFHSLSLFPLDLIAFCFCWYTNISTSAKSRNLEKLDFYSKNKTKTLLFPLRFCNPLIENAQRKTPKQVDGNALSNFGLCLLEGIPGVVLSCTPQKVEAVVWSMKKKKKSLREKCVTGAIISHTATQIVNTFDFSVGGEMLFQERLKHADTFSF